MNRSNVMKIGFSLRIASRESPQFALPIAGSSKLEILAFLFCKDLLVSCRWNKEMKIRAKRLSRESAFVFFSNHFSPKQNLPPTPWETEIQIMALDLGHGEVRVYRGIPRSAANNLGEIPKKIGSSKSLVLKSFRVEGTFWDSSLLVSLALWDTPALFTPPLPLPRKTMV